MYYKFSLILYKNLLGPLTYEGERALGCIRNGALITIGAGILGVPWSIIPKGLDLLEEPTECDGIIKMDMLSQIGGLSGLLNVAFTQIGYIFDYPHGLHFSAYF